MMKDADDKEEANFKFDMTKKGYEIFVVQFMAYEVQRDILMYTIADPGDDLVEPSVYMLGEQEVLDPNDATKTTTQKLMKAEKDLYRANSMSFYKMVKSVPDQLIVMINTVAGRNLNMWKVKSGCNLNLVLMT